MDVAQFLEFMLGSQLAISKSNAETTRKSLLDKAQKDLRSVIETTLPVIYLVKTNDIVNNLLVSLGEMDELTLSKYIVKITDKVEGTIGPAEPGFDEAFDAIYSELVTQYQTGEISSKILAALKKRFNKEIDIKTLGTKVSEISGVMDSAANAYAVTLSLGNSSDTAAISDSLRAEIQKAGKDLRSFLSANTPAQFTDAKDILESFDPSSEILLVGATFRGLKDAINEVASPIIRAWFMSNAITPTNSLNVGTFTAAGHVAVKNTFDEIIGINTPLTQSTLYYANQVAKSNLTMNTFVLDSTHINCALTIKKDVNTVKSLLSLNFSFIVSQESTFNSVTLRDAEVKAMDAIVKKVFKTTRDKLKNQFLKTITSTKGLTYLVSQLRFSPTLKESIGIQIASILSGENPQKVLAIGTAKNIGKEVAKSLVKANSEVIRKLSKKSTSSKNIPKRAKTPSAEKSLTSLQNLINQHLQDVISANMGNGNQRSVLNYRTGRLASSAKVERMSQSREGMITAFYSYMRNPYGTFSEGGRQQYPKSRDPKLLISKSIREIAETQVANRLRAVLA